MTFLSAYLLFLAKVLTAVISIAVLVGVILSMASKSKGSGNHSEDELDITFLNGEINDDKVALEYELMDKAEKKKLKKHPVKPNKERSRLFVIDFDGDIDASETDALRRQITAIIQTAKEKDRVLLRLESPGGVVHGYGLAASQLERLKQAGIELTVAVDKVAASGGYMMACVADEIIAAPFAILGSIGVVAQVPNIHRLLKEKNVDVELHTAGKYKRTLTTLGENTDEGREKFKEELEDVHSLFKLHISTYRPELDVEAVATGETWYGQQAIANNLADRIQTSDDYILNAVKEMDVYQLSIEHKKSMVERLKEQFMKKSKAEINHKYFL